jgi:hypothetical protein
MKLLNLSMWILVGALAVAWTSNAQVPASNDTSDGNANTGMGTGALGGPAASNSGQQNTAAGFDALFNNTSIGNAAFGWQALSSNSTGLYNTAVGAKSLQSNTTGGGNTAVGNNALNGSTTGHDNSATGLSALASNTTGRDNVADGAGALFGNTTGQFNTATGEEALSGGNAPDMTGYENTADGIQSLFSNTTGYQNTASGSYALWSSTVGNHNTASGSYALYSNTNGNSNTADGDNALYSNTTGYHNTASGSNALVSNTTGITNVAFGLEALFSNTTGSNNIAVGTGAGYNLTYGNNNIDIGNEGVATEGGTIRIGTRGTQTATYIAGIENARVTGAAVYVTSSGQLGVLASSERYKTAIAPMGAGTEKLQALRPVSFHLKTDPKGTLQYGLIAEEVAEVYPELVIRDRSGKVQGVRYDELAPMLLNEVQKQAAEIRDLKKLVIDMQAGLLKLQPKDALVSQR